MISPIALLTLCVILTAVNGVPIEESQGPQGIWKFADGAFFFDGESKGVQAMSMHEAMRRGRSGGNHDLSKEV